MVLRSLQKRRFVCPKCRVTLTVLDNPKIARPITKPKCQFCSTVMSPVVTSREVGEDVIFELFPQRASLGWLVDNLISNLASKAFDLWAKWRARD
jgi:hypothetical protein